MAVLLSLLSVCTAYADFCGGLASKRSSAWGVALVALLTGAVLVLSAGLLLGGDPTGADLWWGAVAGVGNGFGTAFLYRGLSSGRMGVVAPVDGVGAAVIPVVVGACCSVSGPRCWSGSGSSSPCPPSGWSRASRPASMP